MLLKPFLKWAGGKTRLLPELLKYVPVRYNDYIEPFLGGGALYFRLCPDAARLSDSNIHLVNTYVVIKYSHRILMSLLSEMKNNKEEYGIIAAKIKHHRECVSASNFIYLNKTGFNGLYRENKNGQYNVPWGKYKNPMLYDRKNIELVHDVLNRNFQYIKCQDFREALASCNCGDFIYADPPYHGGFTAYTAAGFTEQDQTDLAQVCANLATKGCHVLASNSNTDFVKQLWGQYECFDLHEVDAPRSINCDGTGRKKVKELIITNISRKE
ncbi:DNA adenine methylase [Candidatus Magnetobacterium casense]|uniref:Site-specific DNA-methyltransferase (adenine-specific) n=1 Tax=Candidatus Magnetobacterium casense TaxID=1455061 RepID=A0ABS6S0M2_9BACT|nr:Dam family site-specific DNA-(adenine-N6)-methyltransferase [Candidatus Magnetobacterium casensis]MBV6342130.1 Dam family site-specific DNA-(adenine-N6)-methyltransferase [Candidatus Magnetobacterium casensis]